MVRVYEIDKLVAAARQNGWASAVCPAVRLEAEIPWSTYTVVPGRSQTGGFEDLKPAAPDKARPRSLSAIFGHQRQPLHTDGAHLAIPPDIVVLAVDSPSSVSTLLWRQTTRGFADIGDDLQHGLFAVDDGQTSFLAPACVGWPTLGGGRVRFDPGCMTPVDSRARRVVGHFSKAIDSATQFAWTEPNQVLVIDNRNVLHARDNVVDEPDRLMRRLMLRADSENQI